MSSYIKIDRKILDWEWYSNINTSRLFLHMLLRANWKDGRFEGKEINRGSFVSSYSKLSNECGLTVNEIRTAIKHLTLTGEITVRAHAKYSVFTINNYDEYQSINTQEHSQSTSNAHSINKRLTTIEEKKEEKEGKKKELNVFFEQIWNIYPSKKGKGQVSDSKKKELYSIGLEELTRAVERYKAELEKDCGWRKPQNGSTFFNSGYIDYLDRNYEKSKREVEPVKEVDTGDRFSGLEYQMRSELEKQGVIDGQMLFLGSATDEQVKYLQDCGVL